MDHLVAGNALACLKPLFEIKWQRVTIELVCRRTKSGQEAPLPVLDAVLKTAASLPGREMEGPVFFHPRDEPFPLSFTPGKPFTFDLVMPRDGEQDLLFLLESLQILLEDTRRNFIFVQASPPCPRRVADVISEFEAPPDDEVCLEFITPLPFDPPANGRRESLASATLGRLMANRVRRFYGLEFGNDPDYRQAWENVRLLDRFWNYVEHRHKSKSFPGRQYLNGCQGPLFVRGEWGPLLPVLAACTELHAGRRIAAGLGRYRLLPGRSALLSRFTAPATWRKAADRLIHDNDLLNFGEPQETVAAWAYTARDAVLSGDGDLTRLSDSRDRILLSSVLGHVLSRVASSGPQSVRSGTTSVSGSFLSVPAEVLTDRVRPDVLLEWLRSRIPRADGLLADLAGKLLETDHPVHGALSDIFARIALQAASEALGQQGLEHGIAGWAIEIPCLREEAGAVRKTVVQALRMSGFDAREPDIGEHHPGHGPSFPGSGSQGPDEALNPPALRKTLYLSQSFAFAGLDHDSVVLRREGQTLGRIPLRRVSELVSLGGNTLSPKLIQRLVRDGIPVSFCSATGEYLGTLRPEGPAHYRTAQRHAERRWALNDGELLSLARALVRAKLGNYLRWLSGAHAKESAVVRKSIRDLIGKIDSAPSLDALRGLEGRAGRELFPFINSMVRDPGFASAHRTPGRKPDPWNALVDLTSRLFFARLNVLVRGRGLDPYLGFLHSPRDRYESLVCDLQEPFRCRMDRFALKIANLGIVKPADFEERAGGGYQLSGKALGKALEAFEREMDTRLAGDQGALRELFAAQIRVLEHWTQGGDMAFYTAMDRKTLLP